MVEASAFLGCWIDQIVGDGGCVGAWCLYGRHFQHVIGVEREVADATGGCRG